MSPPQACCGVSGSMRGDLMQVSGNSPLPVRLPVATVSQPHARLLATDLQQSILVELDRSGPNLRAYNPYGSPSSLRPTSAGLGFTGQLKERSTGWYHLGNGHRVYNPMLMRFHSPDRLSPFDKGGINSYAYSKGDPVNFKDPTGEYPVSFAQSVQPYLTAGLHVAVTGATLIGPTLRGAALNASRIGLAGSLTSVAGAALHLAGNPLGYQIANVGTAALLAGAIGRMGVGAANAYRGRGLWKTVSDNLKSLLPSLGSTKKPTPPTAMTDVSVITTGNSVPEPFVPTPAVSPVLQRQDALQIRKA
jgi:RHS repeat-associated protein